MKRIFNIVINVSAGISPKGYAGVLYVIFFLLADCNKGFCGADPGQGYFNLGRSKSYAMIRAVSNKRDSYVPFPAGAGKGRSRPCCGACGGAGAGLQKSPV